MAYIYRHVRKDTNEVFYIGLSLKDDEKYKRAYSIHSRSVFWKNIVKKTEYEVHIMLDNLSNDVAKEKEKEFIALYGRSDGGCGTLCNLTDGGDGSINLYISDETRSKLSKASSGENNPMFGKTHSEDAVNKIKAANIGRKRTDKAKENMRLGQIGRKHPQEVRDKISASNKNRVPAFIGRKHTDETKEKLRELNTGSSNPMFGKVGKRKKVIDTNTGIIYDYVADAIISLNLKIAINYLRAMLSGNANNLTSLKYLENN